ncbi:MAG: hypothetical protein HY746_01680 [Elusimicrobia bacterium]|nr:hypothetical protein [Elusimicrobiota bacterium]
MRNKSAKSGRNNRPASQGHPGRKSGLSESERFEICVGAILTQNTSWKNVEKAIESLNRNRMMEPRKLYSAPLIRLSSLIKSSGFFRQKAVKIKRFSEYLLKKHPEGISEWFKNSNPEELRDELFAMYGIGPETADSIVLYAAEKPKFVIDAYTLRIFARIGIFNSPLTKGVVRLRRNGVFKNYHEAQKCFEENLPKDTLMYQEYHALLVKLGKDFCKKKNPLCVGCPIEVLCKKKIQDKK